ncbi:ferredoxin--NADP reductase [Streptomyces sp. SID5910]|uniref:ferredoxin--NADP reductase n=1 Tax=Streptomyces sp. SID5910 TaxID=2690312 RepID=UPI00136F43FA|nr:ferredoxin--NADP reductase [Streptomyces sp. SID5910]MYR44950.1 2Fe-2S iron-sulfur cluster binding domain-containing protein [Streptomyces sp. SID5910]
MSEPTTGATTVPAPEPSPEPANGPASGPASGPANGARTHRLRVVEVIAETADAHSLVLQAPPESARFAYRPGQFLTLKLPGTDGGAAARCYSLASSPHTGEPLKVTVKRVSGGYGSNWVCDHVKAGDELEALPPAGTFTPDSLDTDLLLVAGGSGITPVLSIAKSVLASGQGRLALLYANRDEASVVFRDELRHLAEEHPGRLLVIHWLESLQGLPVAERLAAALAPYADREAFVCGPEPMTAAVEECLRTLGTPDGRIHRERFFSLGPDVFGTPAVPECAPAEGGSTADVELDGETRTVAWPAGTPLLDVLLAAGVDAPYSCREGACSACTCRVVTGEVKMLRNDVLDDQDIAEGYVLACQAVPLTDRVGITYS